MRPANDIALKIGVEKPIFLRPSLRAATYLERSFGFEVLLNKVSEGSLATMADVVSASTDRFDLLAAVQGVPLAEVMPALIDAVSRHVLALAGVNTDAPRQSEQGERLSFADYHAKLFRIATGWLGWSPAEAWNATPSEILEAYSGHLEMLRAVHGSADAEPEQSAPRRAPDQAPLNRKALHALNPRGRGK